MFVFSVSTIILKTIFKRINQINKQDKKGVDEFENTNDATEFVKKN